MNDPQIRALLKSTALGQYAQDAHTIILDELSLPVAGARIDVAVVNGSLHGFEIKSGSDGLSRLGYQIEAYKKVFDFVTVVTEQIHTPKVIALLPKWVGVSVCSDVIDVVREPAQNNEVEGFFLAQLLFRSEMLDLLKCKNIQHNKSSRNWILCETIASNMAVTDVSDSVREVIKTRARPTTKASSPLE